MTMASPAWSQSAPQAPSATEADDPRRLAPNEVELESGQDASDAPSIVVTGSRIANPNLTSTIPITSIGVQELTATGDPSIGEALNDLPSLRSTTNQSNSVRSPGNAGLNYLDLRGLGTSRTLTLVNGRRHVTSSPGAFTADVNTIPVDLIERVDIVTGGNSAVYGSDAVAGVVNFVLKRDFDGIRLRGQAGISSRGDRPSQSLGLTVGRNFADDRGNVAVSLEYSNSDPLYFAQRDKQFGGFSGRTGFLAIEPTSGEPGGSDGIIDTALFSGLKFAGASTGGAFVPSCPAALPPTDPGFGENQRIRALACAANGFGQEYVFVGGGDLVRNVVQLDNRHFNAPFYVGGLGATLFERDQLLIGIDRKVANLVGGFEISPAFRPFVEAKFARIDVLQAGQPSFHSNTFSLDNPFLTAQARSLLQQILPAGATSFTTLRLNADFGPISEHHRRETFRVVAGVDGRFNDDWTYEIALNYGELNTFFSTTGNVNNTKFALARNAVRNSAGQIVCGVNADTNAANDDPACVPVNLFGLGSPSQAALNYFGHVTTRVGKAKQHNATAFVAGDLSQLFELPGGPVGFALGGEYRRETAFEEYDPVTVSGATQIGGALKFAPPVLEVKEAFGEVRVPLLRDMPFAHELSLQAAGRLSSYSAGPAKSVFAYNVAGTWAPIRDIRFRAGYARSVRAPTLLDLYRTARPVDTQITDPCSAPNLTDVRKRNCATLGVPATEVINGQTVPWTNVMTVALRGTARGNPDVNEERGTSITAGMVFQPRFVPGLSFSVDYYDITVRSIIETLTGQTIINQCYDDPTGVDNQYCASVRRQPSGFFAGQTFRTINGGLVPLPPSEGPAYFAQPFNFQRQEASGIDFEAAYRRDLGGTLLNLRAVVTHVLHRNNYTNVLDPNFRTRLKSTVGDPNWAGNFNANLDFGAFDLGYSLRYIGKQLVGAYNTQNEIDGRPPTNADQFPYKYHSDVIYHGLRAGFEASKQFNFYVGVDNLFDRDIPPSLNNTQGSEGIYETLGRYFYAGAQLRF